MIKTYMLIDWEIEAYESWPFKVPSADQGGLSFRVPGDSGELLNLLGDDGNAPGAKTRAAESQALGASS